MFSTIRSRLFASYLLILVLTLVLMAGVGRTILSSTVAPPDFAYNRLELLIASYAVPQFNLVGQGRFRDNNISIVDVTERLDEFAEVNNVRVILVNVEATRVVHDTRGVYAHVNMPDLVQDDHTPTRFPPPRNDDNNNERRSSNNPSNNNSLAGMTFGSFVDEDDSEWLYARVSPRLQVPLVRADNLSLILAEERTNLSIGSEIGNLTGAIWQPFVRSALIAGLVAFVIALILGRTLTSPLRRLASAAEEVAGGNYPEVPVKGPDEIQQVATAFNYMTSEVQATQQSQRDFLANVSHDLKTPLTSIQGYSQAIIDGAARDPQKAAVIIHEEATRLNRMVTELTDLARLQAGRLSMKMEALDIGALVGGIGERLRVVAEKKDITLHVQSANVPAISGDGDRLVQVMTNIIGNAIKYTPTGGNVWVTMGVARGGVVITVRDDGMGIPQEDLPRIFDRFYQVDKARGPQRGTGLGLAITREIVLGHGGDINISSAGANQGTTVTIWLPSPQLTTAVTRRVTVD